MFNCVACGRKLEIVTTISINSNGKKIRHTTYHHKCVDRDYPEQFEKENYSFTERLNYGNFLLAMNDED